MTKPSPPPEPSHHWDPRDPAGSNPPICDKVNGAEIALADRCPRCAVFVGPRPGERYHCEAWRVLWREDGKRIPKTETVNGRQQFLLFEV